MRMSCNGCRVLRKGCSENCSIRPCLQWIKSPDSQANATVFLAKFYGRAGLMNLINAGPEHLRPAIFRSLLYEACGRIVNPIYGSVGLLWSGSWQLCQNAVEAVLNGSPITQITSDTAETNNGPPFKAYDIRHISKDETNNSAGGSNDLNRVRTRGRFKRTGTKKGKTSRVWIGPDESGENNNNELSSHESALSCEPAAQVEESCEVVEESLASAETPTAAKKQGETEAEAKAEAETEAEVVELELTLGHEPVERIKVKEVLNNNAAAVDGMDLRLDYSV